MKWCRSVLRQEARESLKRKTVAYWPESRNLAEANRRQKRSMAELLADGEVGQMDLDGGKANRSDGIAQRDAGVGQPAGIDDDSAGLFARLLDPVNEGAFVVRLEGLDLQTQFPTPLLQTRVDFLQGGVPIDVGLS